MSNSIKKFTASDAIVREIVFHENFPQISLAGERAAASWEAVHTYHESGSAEKESLLVGYVVYDDDRGRVVGFHWKEADALEKAAIGEEFSVGEVRLTRELYEKRRAEVLRAACEYTKRAAGWMKSLRTQ